MEFDQTYNGVNVDWNFPSPTATPTTTTYNHHGFQTPKSATTSYFQDAFVTPQVPPFATPQDTQLPIFPPAQLPQTSTGNGNMGVALPDQQWHGRYMLNTDNTTPAGIADNTHLASMQHAPTQVASNVSFDGVQMQTPPPTRGTIVKRVAAPQQVIFGTPSTIADRRFATPQPLVRFNSGHNPDHYNLNTPIQFPQLQVSPEMYQFSRPDAAAAPPLHENSMFWANPAHQTAVVPSNTLDDPFAPNISGWSIHAPGQTNTHAVDLGSHAGNEFPIHPSDFGPFTTNPTRSNGVNPSLVYSSPVRPMSRSSERNEEHNERSNLSTSTGTKPLFRPTGAGDSNSSKSGKDSSNVPVLRRSNTTGSAGVLTQSSRPLSNALLALSNDDTNHPVPVRTVSPLKRSRKSPLGAIREAKIDRRRSVVLTIDENGRARTETRQIEDNSTRSLRERYPALFDSDSSDEDDSDATDSTPSRTAPSISAPREERRSKAAKISTPVENFEKLTIPCSGSSSSSTRKVVAPSKAALATAAELRRNGSTRRPSSTRSTRRSPLIGSHSSRTESSSTVTVDRQPHRSPSLVVPAEGAGITLQSGIEGQRGFAQIHNHLQDAERELEAHNRRWSFMSLEQQQVSHPHLSSQPTAPVHGQVAGTASISPNPFHPTAFAQTPVIPSSSPTLNQRPIRCSCGNSTDTGHPLLQCTSCAHWVHTSCAGWLSPAAGSNFICFLCRPQHGPVIDHQHILPTQTHHNAFSTGNFL